MMYTQNQNKNKLTETISVHVWLHDDMLDVPPENQWEPFFFKPPLTSASMLEHAAHTAGETVVSYS